MDLSSSEECTLSDELALKLGRIAVYLDNSYGSPRDIEWAISNGKIFLLQVIVTNCHLI